jgi:hypothetical protein
VYLEIAAMGDFEAGPGGDSFLFEFSIDGGAFQPLFTSSVDEAASQTYFMDNGAQVVRDDPLSVNGVVLNNEFQFISAVIPAGGSQIRIRFTATNDGPSEAFAWGNLNVDGQNSNLHSGAAVQFDASADRFAAYAADPDYTIAGDMFGVRTGANPGIPGLPSDITDDSTSSPRDTQGIVGPLYAGQFFGVADTVNGVGNDTNTATWTFNGILVSLDPKLGPLADNGGLTRTHSLLAGSPAIAAGDPTAVAGMGTVPLYDQRGAPYGRVVNGDEVPGARIDMGAFESVPPAPALPGDYNKDGLVDASDYVVWRKALNTNLLPYSGADGNGNGVADQADYGFWRAGFGETLLPPGASSGESIATAVAEPITPIPGATSENGSESLHDSAPSQAVEPRGSHAVVLAPGYSRTVHRPSARAFLGTGLTSIENRRDDALVAWMATRSVTTPQVEGFDEPKAWNRDEANSAIDLNLDSVDRVFAQMASA